MPVPSTTLVPLGGGGLRTRDKSKHEEKKTPPETTHARLPKWIGNPFDICAPLSDADKKEAASRMAQELLKGKVPAGGASPHIIFTIGSPGSGKSTVAGTVAGIIFSGQKMDSTYKRENYVVLDFDSLVKYHPKWNDIWSIPDMNGSPTGVGFAFGWGQCVGSLMPLGQAFLDKVMAQKYNIIVQTHSQESIIEAQQSGYVVTLVYVAAPLELAKARARDRAVKTGMFIADSVSQQDEWIEQSWHWYQKSTPWFALWCHTFMVVPNDTDSKLPIESDFLIIDPHAQSWEISVRKMQSAIASGHAHKPKKET